MPIEGWTFSGTISSAFWTVYWARRYPKAVIALFCDLHSGEVRLYLFVNHIREAYAARMVKNAIASNGVSVLFSVEDWDLVVRLAEAL